METLMSIWKLFKAIVIVAFRFSIFVAMVVGFIGYCKEEKAKERYYEK
jgi:hypothetical protein